MVKLSNPFAFTPGPVTAFTTLVYVALIAILIVIHTTVPPAPKSPTPIKGLNLTEAWLDLQTLTTFYHPYNSRENDDVRAFLTSRISDILQSNGVSTRYPNAVGSAGSVAYPSTDNHAAEVFVFDDLESNVTFSMTSFIGVGEGISVYFEGTNIIVYIRGVEDDDSAWWDKKNGSPSGRGGVLVNAHYDSVSTGYGATDDGMGVVTVLQLIKYYSTSGNKPTKGLVALLNNGEEDGLLGAKAFALHPMAKFPHTFVNLEGAGAGKRAHMFRATDAEVAQAYGNTDRPFSSVVSSDGFKLGAVRSQTDYVVFNGDLGMRGLDIAFMEPRARYHTDQDDTRHAGKASLWHMLSAALDTTKSLTSDMSDRFDGDSGPKNKIHAGKGAVGVWFDLFGRGFAAFHLHTFFALSVTLLVVVPIFLLITSSVLYKVDKFYLFSASRLYHVLDGDEEIKLYGWRGFFRFPIIIVIACATPIALAFLLTKQNPFIIHSSQWSVWAMMFSSWIFVAWFCCCAAYFTRPSALTRIYGYIWLTVLLWALLVVNTIFETQLKLASGYFLIFYFAALAVVTWLSHLELFALPRKSKYCHSKMGGYESLANSQLLGADGSDRNIPTDREEGIDDIDGEEASESTSLLRNEGRRTTFANYTRNEDTVDEAPAETPAAETSSYTSIGEQEWSASLPRWTWFVQLIILAPIAIIFNMQTGFLLTSAVHQTGPDGSSLLLGYLVQAIFTILTLLPLLPILHRLSWPVPHFLFLVLIGTLVYNLVAFPFSTNNRLKLYFQQTVDIDTGRNDVILDGPQPYLRQAISTLPSAAGQNVLCVAAPGKENIQRCSWSGLPPNVVPSTSPSDMEIPPEKRYRAWLNFNVTKPSPATPSNPNSARFFVHGKDTRACRLSFDNPIVNFREIGSGPSDKRFPSTPEGGSKDVRLWSRSWNKVWGVDVEWDEEEEFDANADGFQGKVICLWADENQLGVIPALDEIRHFAPDWSAVSKAGSGLVEVGKRFSI
ncbi:putative peptidase family m28 family [Phaeomoniella chlamydospora]|uniref:Peptide hydrolase n=1 Tax=Phaeomoniella chlamydospora TaxID=158046 RepID=A0A0G2EFU3_PHACM|nr:putative peptidase family m28 family [Phaeomoniella chlamydospora]